MEYGELYYDKRNIKRRKYLKYNNKCGYSRKGSPQCPFCHPKRNNNSGIIDFNVYNKINKNTKKNIYINCYMANKDNNKDLIHLKVRLLPSSFY